MPPHADQSWTNSWSLAGLGRAVLFLAFWLILTGAERSALAVGFATSALAAWLSLRLMPETPGRIRLLGLPAFCARFLWQSVSAGLDIARRVFHPALPLHPGILACPLALHEGPARQAFCTLISLQPGTLPLGTGDGGSLRLHCLDATLPIAAQLAQEADRWTRTFGRDPANG
jgi:multicomponent Na+:H+ antiporter subunit E